MPYYNQMEGVSNRTERELIVAAKGGDIAAFEALVVRHYKRAYNYAVRISGGDKTLAFDITQEAFVKAFVSIKTFKEGSPFSTWLWRIVYNTFIDFVRREGDAEELDESRFSASGGEEDNLITKERRENLYKLLEKLPTEYRDVVILIEILGFSYEEVAEIVAAPLGTVKSRLFRARNELKELIWLNRELFGQ
ncbi:MAG: sigma-70 family RNA polymerase sigma factor [Myxococcota bacterium]